MGGLYSPPYGGKIPKMPGDKLTMSTRAALNSYLNDGNTVANYQAGVGLTNIGGNATAWANQIGIAGPLVGHGAGGGPTINADGSILFNGIDQYANAAFVLNKPVSIYLVVTPIAWVNGDFIYDGLAGPYTGGLRQIPAIPQLTAMGDGLNVKTITTPGPANGIKGVVTSILNGAASTLQLNQSAPVAGDTGLTAMAGFVLGCAGNLTAFANFTAHEVMIRQIADSAAYATNIIMLLQAMYNIP